MTFNILVEVLKFNTANTVFENSKTKWTSVGRREKYQINVFAFSTVHISYLAKAHNGSVCVSF